MKYVRNAGGVTQSVNAVCADKAVYVSQNKRLLTAAPLKSN